MLVGGLLLLLLGFVVEWVRANNVNASTNVSSSLPTVNLGYSIYRATSINETGAYYNFSNIRFAAPPVGKLRFADPAPPLKETGIQDGALGYICPQSTPGYWNVALKELGDLVNYLPGNIPGQSQSEDCLFLDVMAPVKVFNSARSHSPKPVPVLVNIHGGGFFIGDKTTIYNPQGFLRQSNNGLVYVSMNYRLGAFGFLTGMEKSASNRTSPNAGLLDQRFALKWVQKYIHLFGGDAKQVTILGQSAGGGSVQLHTVAYGGRKPNENHLFKGAIAQSPAPIIVDPKWQTLAANRFLDAAGARTVDDLRTKSTEVLQEAQQKAQEPAPFTVEFFGPTVDGDLIPDLERKLYSRGQYIKNLKIMSSHNANEGRLFANESATTDADYDNWVRHNFPSASPKVWSYISKTLYPPIYDGSKPYNSSLGRLQLTTLEYLIACNSVAMARAYDGKSYNYDFSIPPAIHSQDLVYTYYNGESGTADPDVALPLQKGLTEFVLTGNPNGRQRGDFPQFGRKSQVLNFAASGRQQVRESAVNERCDWWLKGLYAPNPPSTRPRYGGSVDAS